MMNYRKVLHKYMIDKEGNVYNKHTKKIISPKIRRDRKRVRLYTWVNSTTNKCIWYDVAELLFFAFHPEYNKHKYKVVSRTGNYIDFTLDDLEAVEYEAI